MKHAIALCLSVWTTCGCASSAPEAALGSYSGELEATYSRNGVDRGRESEDDGTLLLKDDGGLVVVPRYSYRGRLYSCEFATEKSSDSLFILEEGSTCTIERTDCTLGLTLESGDLTIEGSTVTLVSSGTIEGCGETVAFSGTFTGTRASSPADGG